MKAKLTRLDKYLADNGLVESRTLAQEYIAAGRVSVNGLVVTKTASQVAEGAKVSVDTQTRQWVSRGAHKLLKAVEFFNIDVNGKVCIDIGASTGGFTDVLLAHGARRVFAVDVGYGQLAWKLRTDNRVTVMERTNARFLTLDMFGGEKADIIVSDASFISIKLLLPSAQALLKDDGLMAVLIKPQFEVGRERVGHGVVSDPALHCEVLDDIGRFIADDTELEVLGRTFSPIRGPEGNIEFLALLGLRGRSGRAPRPGDAGEIVAEAHRETASGTTDLLKVR